MQHASLYAGNQGRQALQRHVGTLKLQKGTLKQQKGTLKLQKERLNHKRNA